MKDDEMRLQRSVAQGAASDPVMTDMAKKGMIDFLRRQIVEAEWDIARAKASISAYETAIEAIEKRVRTSDD